LRRRVAFLHFEAQHLDEQKIASSKADEARRKSKRTRIRSKQEHV
jgi:hypothetical protein